MTDNSTVPEVNAIVSENNGQVNGVEILILPVDDGNVAITCIVQGNEAIFQSIWRKLAPLKACVPRNHGYRFCMPVT